MRHFVTLGTPNLRRERQGPQGPRRVSGRVPSTGSLGCPPAAGEGGDLARPRPQEVARSQTPRLTPVAGRARPPPRTPPPLGMGRGRPFPGRSTGAKAKARPGAGRACE